MNQSNLRSPKIESLLKYNFVQRSYCSVVIDEWKSTEDLCPFFLRCKLRNYVN